MKKSKSETVFEMARIIEAAEFKAGDNVKFKEGQQMAGTLGRVAAINPDGTISVKIGNALQPPVSPDQLELVDYAAQNKVGGAAASTEPAPAAVASIAST